MPTKEHSHFQYYCAYRITARSSLPDRLIQTCGGLTNRENVQLKYSIQMDCARERWNNIKAPSERSIMEAKRTEKSTQLNFIDNRGKMWNFYLMKCHVSRSCVRKALY